MANSRLCQHHSQHADHNFVYNLRHCNIHDCVNINHNMLIIILFIIYDIVLRSTKIVHKLTTKMLKLDRRWYVCTCIKAQNGGFVNAENYNFWWHKFLHFWRNGTRVPGQILQFWHKKLWVLGAPNVIFFFQLISIFSHSFLCMSKNGTFGENGTFGIRI